MLLTKDGKEYTIIERAKSWTVSHKVDKLSVEYNVSKELCKDEEELRTYIEKEKIF